MGPDGVGPRHVVNGIEGVIEYSLQGNCVPGCHCGKVSCLSQAGVGTTGCRGP